MNKEQIEFCSKNLLSVSVSSILMLNDETLHLEGDIEKHLNFFKESEELPDSFLVFKYFGEDLFQDEKILDNGDYSFFVTRMTKIRLKFMDEGEIYITDIVNANVDMWIKESKQIDKLFKVFDTETDVLEIYNYYLDQNMDDFKYNDKEAYLALKEIGMLKK